MATSNDSITNNLQNNIADIIQIPLFVLISILASVYIILVLSQKTLRSNKYTWLTINICLVNILFALMQLLSIGFRINNTSEVTVSCRLRGFILNMAACQIMYSHSIASFCRLLLVQYPHKRLFRSSHWLLGSIGMSWIVGSLVALPFLFFDGFTCLSNDGRRFLQIYSSVSTIFMPITIVTICNIIIFLHVRQSSKRIRDFNNNDNSNNNNNNQFSRRDMHLCKIMLLTFCIFVIGWTPIFFEQLFNNGNGIPLGVTTFFRILPSASLLADVILLIYSDQPVFRVLLKIFKRH